MRDLDTGHWQTTTRTASLATRGNVPCTAWSSGRLFAFTVHRLRRNVWSFKHKQCVCVHIRDWTSFWRVRLQETTAITVKDYFMSTNFFIFYFFKYTKFLWINLKYHCLSVVLPFLFLYLFQLKSNLAVTSSHACWCFLSFARLTVVSQAVSKPRTWLTACITPSQDLVVKCYSIH